LFYSASICCNFNGIYLVNISDPPAPKFVHDKWNIGSNQIFWLTRLCRGRILVASPEEFDTTLLEGKQMAGEERRILFTTVDGLQLEGALHLPDESPPFPAAVMCHPHPQMGGDMENPIVVAVCRELAVRGWAALRFNFRGKGRSEGAFEGGRGEMEDVAGALDYLCSRVDVDSDRLAVAGYSFGAAVGLRHAARDPRVGWLVGIALTQDNYEDPFLDSETRPKLFIVGARDAWAPRDALQVYVGRLQSPKLLHVVEGDDHFFGGREAQVAATVADWLAEVS
jgi:alpha/beta superfamily hydrolase